MSSAPLRITRIHPAWVVAGATFVVLVMAAGFRSTAGVLLVPLHETFGWSHEAISLAVGINLVCYGLGVPFTAALALKPWSHKNHAQARSTAGGRRCDRRERDERPC